MQRWLSLSYGAVARAAEWIARAAPASGTSKLSRGLAHRSGALARYRAWSARHRDRARPLVWMHAASVGEGLMAAPVLARVRRALPHAQLVYTYYSPSAEAFADRVTADFTDFLPFDSARAAREALDALAPTVLAFVKGDVWPVLTATAASRGVKLALLSASVPERSRRVTRLGGLLTRDAYAALDLAGAASREDAALLVRAGAHADRVRVTGDTRYDQAWERAHSAPRNAELVSALRTDRPTVVAGSTWPTDERALLPAWERVRATVRDARLVIAPHELHESQLAHLERWSAAHGMRSVRIDAADAGSADVVLVDRMGILADLYALATAAYVGGGFHGAGLHSLVEPAVFRVPTVVGPQRAASRDARLMLAAGGVMGISDATGLAAALTTLLTDRAEHAARAEAMGTVVAAELGAAERSFQIVRELLGAV
jgi:3-deoxy-D-manno-octulosonic-acid transferase